MPPASWRGAKSAWPAASTSPSAPPRPRLGRVRHPHAIRVPMAQRGHRRRDRILDGSTGHPVRWQYKPPSQPDVLPAPDAILVAPLTNNTLAKWATAISDTPALGLITEGIGPGLPISALPHFTSTTSKPRTLPWPATSPSCAKRASPCCSGKAASCPTSPSTETSTPTRGRPPSPHSPLDHRSPDGRAQGGPGVPRPTPAKWRPPGRDLLVGCAGECSGDGREVQPLDVPDAPGEGAIKVRAASRRAWTRSGVNLSGSMGNIIIQPSQRAASRSAGMSARTAPRACPVARSEASRSRWREMAASP